MSTDYKKVLITGGAGFIGSHIAKKLLEKGFSIRLFDLNFANQEILWQKLGIFGSVEKITGDILDKEALGKAVQGCDFVIHAAAMLGVKNTEEHKLECLNANLLGTINVLDACVKGNIKRLVFTSSSEVYGEALNPPIVETSPRSPVSPYGVSKLASEEYIKAYNQKYGLEFSVVRFFNVYGPGQVAQFVMPRFIKNVRQGESPVLYGDGLQVRAFCFVEDAVEGVYKVLNQPAAKNEIFNIGNDAEPITMKELAQKVIAVSGKDIKPVLVPMQDSDREVSREIVKRIPSVQKARQVLGYEPKVSVDEGIKKTMEIDYIIDNWTKP
ncbi:MAG: hypothetical protein A3C50_03625 [Candidatus Staskawiczbacteria bacterium RIFCSPHIGHO2_02_FULL_43_16]|uniref:NAD-dependent epimerase/dehydratase domain-containing protein n=1 Tax=Candidatus Staskawiczbacteria bacterium RIFCSPHIGHO2_01_FULL_41_41 TaxID=1802203 RepID=A0A1G2HSH8_9BACT|nr:MAG: hypothetical protein A2822_02730 [Candidatus Staskawiczbacteria bacterium RIFCSPHIGHO2_01_FULL_41_41]OGZ68026.1 MAG: hypothetical protein A3C50_03625 [Candidatus Staskawiczbacteria bacterium RIFCSPHIGHO2_02_FULL_43_16]OGZ74592.1 MAG: hypothetical protein A3A12_02425 [Candidatus Staskawiczbacteria bacterium RIFCSPLOWO2_01_FULL_43_17b]